MYHAVRSIFPWSKKYFAHVCLGQLLVCVTICLFNSQESVTSPEPFPVKSINFSCGTTNNNVLNHVNNWYGNQIPHLWCSVCGTLCINKHDKK